MICDPPDNIGLGYNSYDDNLPSDEYIDLFEEWLKVFLLHADIVWVSFNAIWLVDVCNVLGHNANRWRGQQGADIDARLFMQTFTFGQNQRADCGNGYRPLLRLKHKDAEIYPDAIKVPSARQTKYNDKRAKPGGCVPLDVWEFPRVCGTFKQRRKWHKTQLHEGLVERIIKFSTLPGEPICDVFSGTGTVLRAVNNLSEKNYRNPVTSIELDPYYCEQIAAEHELAVETFGKAAA